MMALTGLTDDYEHDGRVISEMLDRNILPYALKQHKETLERLGQAYKQIEAPFGALAMASLKVSTAAALASTSTNDATYTTLEGDIAGWTQHAIRSETR
jgi:hypothetical protein